MEVSIITIILHLAWGYPSNFWHFNTASTPGPGLTLYNANISPAGTLVMDGQGYAQVNSALTFGDRLSLVIRFFPTSAPDGSPLIDFGNGSPLDNMIIALGNGTLTFYSYTGTTLSTGTCTQTPYILNQWNTIAIQIGGGAFYLWTLPYAACGRYVTSPPMMTRTQQYIGRSNLPGVPTWRGELDFMWHVNRLMSGSDLMFMNLIDGDFIAKAWTFQSPSVLGAGVSTIGNPSFSGGALSLTGNSTQGGLVSPSAGVIGGQITITARVRMDAYQSWARVFDFSNSGVDNIVLSALGQTDTAFMAIYRGTQAMTATCAQFWQLGVWVEVAFAAAGNAYYLAKDGTIICNPYNIGWEPNPVTRNTQYVGKYSSSTDGGWIGAIQNVMYWPRVLSTGELWYITAVQKARTYVAGTTFSSMVLDPPFTSAGSPPLNGQYVTLNGTLSQYIQLSSAIVLATPFAIVVRVSLVSGSNNVVFNFTNGNSDMIALYQVGSSTTIEFAVTTSSGAQVLTCGGFFFVNLFQSIAVTHDGFNAAIYYDGNPFCSGQMPSPAPIVRSQQYIGRGWAGYIDYFFVYNQALISPDIVCFPNAYDRMATICPPALLPSSRLNIGTCVDNGRQGTTCQLACNSPYIGLNSVPGLCTTLMGAENASWINQNLTCVVQCSNLTVPQYGSLSCVDSYGPAMENSVCSFTCAAGFAVVGSSSTTCVPTGGGTWTSPPPSCVPVSCPFSPVQYGNSSCSGPYGPSGYQASCSFTCQVGFSRSGAATTACLSNGAWSNQFPTCTLLSCPPLVLTGGTVSCQNPYGGAWTYGTTCSFACGANYTITGPQQTVCNVNMLWNSTLPVCNLIICPAQFAPSQGNMTCDQGAFGVPYGVTSTCIYGCTSGYQLTNSSAQVCLTTGQWSIPSPKCVDINECATPGTCPSGSTCINFNGTYVCSPAFGASIQSSQTGTSVLPSPMGDRVNFTLYTGYGVDFDLTTISYTLLSTSNGRSTPCTNMTNTSISANVISVKCAIGPGLGSGINLTLSYSRSRVVLGVVKSAPFQYPSPNITADTLYIVGSNAAPGTTVLALNYEQGDIISFSGSGFLPDPTLLSVTYAPYLSSLISTCTLLINLCNATTITCRTQPFCSGIDMLFTVNANGVTVTGSDTYSVVNIPNVLSVTANRTECISAGNLLYDCPTTGNIPIVISANYLSVSSLNGFVGGLLCSYIAPLLNDNSAITVYYFTCLLPSGTGFNRTVVVVAGGKYSQPRNLVSYAAPTIFNISGCVQVNPLKVTNCDRQGGDLLVVVGMNFGADGASVMVGGQRCLSTTHDSVEPHSRVVCVMPPGFSLTRQVQLYQAAGPFSQTQITADYTQCDPGTFQQSSETACGICQAGTYSSTSGAFTCLPCDPGRYSPENHAAACLLCQPGSAQLSGGMSYCTSCAPGYYTSADAAVSCIPCNPGTNTSRVGSTSCSACAAGSSSPDLGMANCTLCRGGFAAESQSPQCQLCPAGTFSTPGSATCSSCEAGYFQPTAGSTFCQACGAGLYGPTVGRVDCLSCESGYASSASAATSCGICLAGSVSQRDSSSLIGATGCSLCAPGTYMESKGQAVCIACSPGYFANNSGSTVCDPCDLGYYQPSQASAQCEPCPLGSYTALPGRPECFLCGSGTKSNSSTATSCTDCQAGTYSVAATTVGVIECSPCTPGTYINTVKQVSCFLCPTGSAAPYYGAQACNLCPPGSAAPAGGLSSCSVCSPGRYTEVSAQESCTICPIGKYTSSSNSTYCNDCAKGYYQTQTGASYCDGCGPGEITSVVGREVCTPCPLGQYSAIANSSVCTDCQSGEFQSSTGVSFCHRCSAGTSNPSTGQSACISCALGTFSNNTGMSVCASCPAGSYRDKTELTTCPLCPAGSWSLAGSFRCLDCSPGLVAKSAGSTSCVPCQNNSYADVDQTTCLCNAGFYLDGEICYPCPVGAVCERGTDRKSIPTENGYYLSDNESLTYQKCLSPKSCVGGQCVSHRTGLLCSQCQPGYSMSEWTKECTSCKTRTYSVAAMVLTILGLLIAVFVLYGYIITSALNAYAATSAPSQAGSVRPGRTNSNLQFDGSASGLRTSAVDGTTRPSVANGGVVNRPQGQPGQSGQLGEVSKVNRGTNLDLSTELMMLNSTVHRDKKHVSDNTYVMKIIVNFFQVASSLMTLPVAGAIAFPTYFMTFLSYFKFFNIDFIPWQNVACLFPANFYSKMVVLTVVPAGLLLALAAVVLVATVIMDCRDWSDENAGRLRRQKMRYVYIRGAIFTAFMLYPMISSTVLAHFVCIKVGRQVFLIADFSIVCYGPVWTRWTPYAAVMTVIYPIGVPLLFITLLYKYRNDLQSPFASLGLGFLHESYNPRVWWFEVLVMVEKLTLTSLLQFLPLNLQLGGGIAVASTFLIILVLVQPELRIRNWLLHMLANVEIVMLLLVWHFSYRENISTAPVVIDACVSALFIGLTMTLATLLFLDLLRWIKEKVFALIRTYQRGDHMNANTGSDIIATD